MPFVSFGGGELITAPNAKPFTRSNVCKIGNSWRIVIPTETTNMVFNPSAEIASDTYSVIGSGFVSRSTTCQKYGLYSYLVVTAGEGDGLSLAIDTLSAIPHFVTMRIRGDIVPTLNVTLSQTIRLQYIENIDPDWMLFGALFSAEGADGATSLDITQIGEGTASIYIDGVQVEPLPYWTTYCDGTQDGCLWDGTAHDSISTRSDLTRSGGVLKDLYTEFGFFVKHIVGAGAPTLDVNIDSYAVLPGGELNSIKVNPREFTIVGEFIADSEPELHRMRQALYSEFDNDTYPGNQPVKLVFSGADMQKEVSVLYKAGLEGDLAAFYRNFEVGDDRWTKLSKYIEKIALQLIAPDPFWYEVGESAAVISGVTSASYHVVARRSKRTELWSNLGPPSNSGTYVTVYAIAEDATYVYIGGDFQNFNNIANADYIVRYNKATGAYSAMGSGANGAVRAIVVRPEPFPYIFACGDFTSMSGVADTQRIAYWDGSIDTWFGLDDDGGANDIIHDMCFDSQGSGLYVVGEFTAIGLATTTGIAFWDTNTFSAPAGTGLNGNGYAVVLDSQDQPYVGGVFSDVDGNPVNNLTTLVDGTWIGLNDGVNDVVWTLEVTKDDSIIVGGVFTQVDGANIYGITLWNKTGFIPLGQGILGTVLDTAIGQDGYLYAVGEFDEAAGLLDVRSILRYNGYTWAKVGFYMSVNTPSIRTVMVSKFSGDLWVGFDDEASTTIKTSNATSLINEGTGKAYPKIIFEWSGGSGTPPPTLQFIKNKTTNQELLLNYYMTRTEKLIIDLGQTKKSITSDLLGSQTPKPEAVLPSSSFGNWALKPRSNSLISFFYASTGSLICYLLWKDVYKSWD